MTLVLKNPPGCTNYGSNQCLDNGDRMVLANIDYNLIFNNTTRILDKNITISYQVCSINPTSCFDGNSLAVYSGKSKLYLNTTDFESSTLTAYNDNVKYALASCTGGACGNPEQSIKSGETATWSDDLADANATTPPLPQQTASYKSTVTYTPRLADGNGNFFTLQPATTSDDVLITFNYVDPCDKITPPETEQTIVCGESAYFQLTNSPTQYKVNDAYNGKYIREYSCNPNNSFGSIANVTIKFKCPTTPSLKLK